MNQSNYPSLASFVRGGIPSFDQAATWAIKAQTTQMMVDFILMPDGCGTSESRCEEPEIVVEAFCTQLTLKLLSS